MFIENGFDVNILFVDYIFESYDDERKIVLYFVVFNNDIYCIEVFLVVGVDLNLDFFNCLFVVVRVNSYEIVWLFFFYGVNVNCYFMYVNDICFFSVI